MRSKLIPPLVAALALGACGSTTTQYNASVHPAKDRQGHGWAAEGPTMPQQFASVPTETMFDSVTVSEIPLQAFAVAGYTGGSWPTFHELVGHFPHAVAIAINGEDSGACLDVEPGDATPADAVPWVEEGHGCVYSDWSEWTTEIRPALDRAGIPRSHYIAWDAFYNHVPHIDPGFDGTQWTPGCLGKNLDCSQVTRHFLIVATPPLRPCDARCARLHAQIATDRARIRANLAHMRVDAQLVRYWRSRRPGCISPSRTPKRCRAKRALEADIRRRVDDTRYLAGRNAVLRAQIRIDEGRLR